MWIRKYRPKSLKDFVNQEKAKQAFLNWYKNWKAGNKAILLYGPPGIGKSCFVEAFANDNNLELIQLNASDERSAELIKNTITNASKSLSLTGKKKIFLIDEVDGIATRSEFQGLKEIIKAIEESKFPIVFTANDPYERKLLPLRNYVELVKFERIPQREMENKLKDILNKEGIKYDLEVVKEIASRNNGDLRGAINDLEVVARGKKEIGKKDLEVLEYRDREKEIFVALGNVFKSDSFMRAKTAFLNLDEDLDRMILWVEENIPNEYEDLEEIFKAYDSLSKADIFLSRIYSRQHWRYMVYANDLMTVGVSLAKKKVYRKFTSYKMPKLLREIKAIKEEKEELKEIAKKLNCSVKKFENEFIPFFGKDFFKVNE